MKVLLRPVHESVNAQGCRVERRDRIVSNLRYTGRAADVSQRQPFHPRQPFTLT